MTVRRPDWIYDGTVIDDPFGYGERAVDFLCKLRHPKSRLPDQAFDLPFFWDRIVRRIYGPCDSKGRRQVKTVFCLLPRGARKTTIGAGLSLLHTFGWEKIIGGQALAAASAEDQATIAYDEAVAIMRATPWLEKAAKATESTLFLEHPKSGATFRAISSDGGAQLGKTPNFVLADELIAWKNRELWKALRTGLVKVAGSLLIVITQAGRGQENLAFKMLEYARKVQSGEVDDPGFLPILFEMDADADWQDEDLWHLVNPGLAEGFPDIDGLRQLAREAAERPADRDDFRQFNLNVWLDHSASPFVDMAVYDEGSAAIDLKALEGAPCWIAVDMGLTTDLTAVVACWRDGDGFQVHPLFFCPADNLQ
ncbi:MAG: terminase large subunit, partial [Pseudaminobacter sp.]|nr:terminase large subunit [Pseudaminobacter sp.]